MGSPGWLATSDKHWHGWAFASATLMFFALLLLVAPKYVVAGPMSAASVAALFQAVRVRHGGEQ